MATRHVLAELASDYKRRSGQHVAIDSVGGIDAARRIEAGEAFDFVVLASDAIDKLAARACIDPESRVDIARSGVAIAVKSGPSHPDVTTESAVRDAVLAAGSIGYSTGPSGVHLDRLFEKWRISNMIASRIVRAPSGVPVASLIASGKVDLGFQQLSELTNVPGIDVVGMLPPEIQVTTVFAGAVCMASAQPAEAKALLSFFASPAAAGIKRRHGMET